ncbi:MAG: hypothetical protein MUC68_13760 [Burkholderiaceae bacterium]|jgi:hypothetical protein|nr:hypothetical protein [Burkholderiaceae bacterium]
MKLALWIVFAVVAILWTAGAAGMAALTGWTAAQLASGAAADIGATAAQWPVPAWLALWIDPAVLQSAQQALQWGLQNFRESLPWAGALLGWLVPLVWVAWALGLLVMLLLTIAGHVLIGRGTRALRGAQDKMVTSAR